MYRAIGQREENGLQYTIFSGSASAVGGICSDRLGPGQRLAIAIREAGRRITSCNNTITVRWALAHRGVEGNEAADTWAKAAAERTPPGDDPAFLRETSLSHMARRATEARSQATRDWSACGRISKLIIYTQPLAHRTHRPLFCEVSLIR